MDLVSTISLIFDIGWISEDIFGTSAENAQNAAQLARASRASKIGSRAGRIVRIIRLIRLVKLYKTAHQVLIENTKLDEFDHDSLKNMRRESKRASKILKPGQSNKEEDFNGIIFFFLKFII